MPRVLPVDPRAPDPAIVREAARVLAEGGLVALPTETVYGLGALGTDAAAVARVFAAKGRPATHALILHVDGVAMARSLVASWPESADRLAASLWPGPLTLILPRSARVPDAVTGGGATVAVRAPSHPVALAVIRALGAPIAAPSANRYQTVSPTRAEHVVRSLGDAVDLVLDAGPAEHGLESTVVDLAGTTPRVLRPGALDLASLRRVLPDVAWDGPTVVEAGVRASPGTDLRHYSPAGRVVFVQNARDLERALASRGPGEVAFVIARELAPGEGTRGRRLPADPAGYGAALYDALHAADEERASLVIVEDVPEGDAWWAVRDRLRRAGGAGA